MIGQKLGRYSIVERIGAGGMGVVYRAHDEHLERDVALKVLPTGTLADEASRQRFRKEALALARLNHPNIATVHDFNTQEGTDFLVMELVSGTSLSEKLAAGPLPEKEVLRLASQLAEGLAAAHEQNVVHRDLKPANLRLTPDGRLKILDFGLAKLLRPPRDEAVTAGSLSRSQMGVAGTVPYMSPEQLRGEAVDARTDIYAAGCVLYEMATGRRPFQETLSTALTDAILHRPAPPPGRLQPDLSSDLERIILKCLEKDPENRYQSAKELLVDLRRLATLTAIPHAPSPRAPARGRLGSRWQAPPGSAGLLVRVGGVALAVALVVAGLVAFNVGGLRDRLRGPAVPEIHSLAVLPLENLSRDSEQEYFAEGMTEALTAELSKISALKVISRTSAARYRGTDKAMPQIARELGVDALIEGSVLREGDQVRITVQLIHGPTDKHLWAESYQRELRGILALQSEVARAIAAQVHIELTPQEQTQLAGSRSVNPDVYELYLKARYHASRVTLDGFQKSIDFCEQAIRLDPNYAPAYALMAGSYSGLSVFGGGPPSKLMPKALAAAQKSLELDSNLAAGHLMLGTIKRDYEWDWPGAEREYQRALQLNPSDVLALGMYGVYLTLMKRFDEAQAQFSRAHALDPLNLDNGNNLGFTAYVRRQPDRAIEAYKKTIDLDPNFVMARRELGMVYSAAGHHAEAVAEAEKAVSLSRDPYTLAMLGHVYAVAGKKDQARKILEELRERSRQSYVSPYYFGDLHAALGERDEAFRWFEKAYQERATPLTWMRVDPRFDPLRDDPRFQSLMHRIFPDEPPPADR